MVQSAKVFFQKRAAALASDWNDIPLWVIDAAKDFANEHLEASKIAVAKQARVIVTLYRMESYRVKCVDSDKANKQHKDGFGVDIDHRSLLEAYPTSKVK